MQPKFKIPLNTILHDFIYKILIKKGYNWFDDAKKYSIVDYYDLYVKTKP